MERGGYVIIANHMSYVDGIVLGSIFPIVFVSKREVHSWPVVGQWNILCGTIFIDRQRKGLVGRLVRRDGAQAQAGRKYSVYFPRARRPTANTCCRFKPCHWRRRCAAVRSSCRRRSRIKPSTTPVSAANRDLDLLVRRDGFRHTFLEAVGAARRRGADNDPAQDRMFSLPG